MGSETNFVFGDIPAADPESMNVRFVKEGGDPDRYSGNVPFLSGDDDTGGTPGVVRAPNPGDVSAGKMLHASGIFQVPRMARDDRHDTTETITDQDPTSADDTSRNSRGMLVTFDNAAAIAVTLDSDVPAGFMCAVLALDGAGVVTLTPSSGTINGGASLAVTEGFLLWNGADWRFIALSGGGGTWGSIGGTLSAQTDLQGALDAKLDDSQLDTDGTLAANSDSKIASQKATKTYSDTKIASSFLDTDGTLAANSDSKVATQKATKTYADTKATKAAVQQESYNYAADSGSANTYAVTLSPAPTVVAGSRVIFKAANANSGASTLNVNSGGAVAIKKNGSSALASGDIVSNQIVSLIYDGTNWQMVAGAVGPAGVSGITPPTPPNESLFSWVNQGVATINGGTTVPSIFQQSTGLGGVNIRARVKTAPSTPYTVYMRATAMRDSNSGIWRFGFLLRNSSSGKMISFDWNVTNNGVANAALTFACNKWDGVNTFNSSQALSSTIPAPFATNLQSANALLFKMVNDGVNRTFYIDPVTNPSGTDQRTWYQVLQIGSTSFITENQIGYFSDSESASGSLYVAIFDWVES
jgi:hypothetical protein